MNILRMPFYEAECSSGIAVSPVAYIFPCVCFVLSRFHRDFNATPGMDGWIDLTRLGHTSNKTMNIISFMARILFFLPDKHRKMLRYYGMAGYFLTSCHGPAGGLPVRTMPIILIKSLK
jgi:hypothetical protein